MDLDQLDKLLKVKSSGGTNRRNITLDDLSQEILGTFSNNRSDSIRTAIYNMYHNPFIVVKIVNVHNGRILYACDKVINYYKLNYMFKFLGGSSSIALDLSNFGPGAFDISVIGNFKSMIEALDYRDYKINLDLNAGLVLYNEEVYSGVTSRVIHIPVSNILINEITSILVARKLTLNRLINKFLIKYYAKFTETL